MSVDLGGYQSDAIRNIIGHIYGYAGNGSPTATGALAVTIGSSGKYQLASSGPNLNYGDLSLNAASLVPTAAENRPKSTSLNYYIYVY